MKGIVRLVIKLVVYIGIVIPVVRSTIGALLGGGGFGWIVGLIVAIGLAIWLETTGTSNRLLVKLFSGKSDSAKDVSVGEAVGSLFSDGAPKGLETTMKCPNCGAQVTLYDGHGKCRACDSAF